jgi:glyoxylase-like metal-dependent hydrolase (beta-lactamase superfamily II)/rhodanese-related sulfurtransferase
MNIEQIYTGCLAQGAYYIESNGEVAIIDPLRETQPYINRATIDGAKIKYIFETHFHADFVSGHVTLAKQTGAEIIFGPNAETFYKATIAKDNQEFKLGNIIIKVLHTPGHTMESTTYLLINEKGENHAIFSGDTLFIGDVGRPDLAQKNGSITENDLAGYLYDSLRTKIMTLQDDVIVYPAHGAGSACGKNMSKETTGTIGDQKKTNYALRADMSKDEFINEVTEGLLPPPAYFPQNVQMNKEGYDDLNTIIKRGTKGFNPDEFELKANESSAIILDVRNQNDFVLGHIPRSIFIGIDGGFAPWVGALIADVKQPILLVTPEGREEEVITRLSRVGFDNTLGYLKGSYLAWEKSGKETDSIRSISAEDFALEMGNIKVFDVRKVGEYQSTHVTNATHTPLSKINDYLENYKTEKTSYIHCAGGYRSVIAASILKSRGIHNFTDVKGGFGAIKKTNISISEYVCPSTLQ